MGRSAEGRWGDGVLVLSVRQPWAWAIITPGVGKDIENRTWPTKVRGRVAIHASKGCTVDEYNDAIDFLLAAGVRKTHIGAAGIAAGEYANLVRGAILGTVEIVDCVTSSTSPWFVGTYGFVLRDPKPLAVSIPWTGMLGFRELPDDIARRLP